jgi:two-component system, cell cycle response regulator
VDTTRNDELRILIVDAQADARAWLRQQLAGSPELRFVFEEAASGEEALAKLEQPGVQCVLLEGALEGGGVAWVGRLRQQAPLVPIIVLASQGGEELAVASLKSGAQDYINKGRLEGTTLRDAVLAAVDRAQQAQILEAQKQKLLEEERLRVLMHLAGATAHELNQPLTGLIGFCQLLHRDPSCPPGLLPIVDNIVRSAHQIHGVLQQVRMVSPKDLSAAVPQPAAVVFSRPFEVLTVEDSDADFERVSQLLDAEMGQLRLTRAKNLGAALRLCGERAFDLCLVDYQLPDGHGIAFAEMIKHAGQTVPCILVTGLGGESLAAEAFRRGFYDYLPKHELSRAVLPRSIWNALERARMLREIEEATRRISELSARDKVTGLWNRHRLDERLIEEFTRSRRYKPPVTIAICDLDHFKSVNDSFGHATGDRVLRESAGLMKAALRQTDFIGRYGGEEFCLVFTNTELLDAALCCERIRQRIENEKFASENSATFSITVSFGLAQCGEQHDAVEALLSDADRALYGAKNQGRNQVYVSVEGGLLPWSQAGGPGSIPTAKSEGLTTPAEEPAEDRKSAS